MITEGVVYLSIIQAGFSADGQMAKFNRFQGLQSQIKQLSIYTVVLLYSCSNETKVAGSRMNGNQGGIKREFADYQHKERGYYGR
ncbi:Uncharacterised protein [Halioglobus japonicus]|nr:Uncharacterised protein [Halioglobus japonicus]